MGVVPSRCMSETMCMASSFLIVADDDIIQRVFARAMHVELVYGECYVHEIQPVIADIPTSKENGVGRTAASLQAAQLFSKISRNSCEANLGDTLVPTYHLYCGLDC